MSAQSLLLLGLLKLAEAASPSPSSLTPPSSPTPDGGGATAVIIIVVIVVLLALGGAAYWFVFRPGAMYSSLWSKRIAGSSPITTAAAMGANPNNNLPMVALRVSEDEEL
jgi:flagellar basal body-associated protein FliL